MGGRVAAAATATSKWSVVAPLLWAAGARASPPPQLPHPPTLPTTPPCYNLASIYDNASSPLHGWLPAYLSTPPLPLPPPRAQRAHGFW